MAAEAVAYGNAGTVAYGNVAAVAYVHVAGDRRNAARRDEAPWALGQGLAAGAHRNYRNDHAW